MVHPSPRITTVNRSAERRARLEDARWPAARRRLFRFAGRAASLCLSLAVMLHAFPWLLDAARVHPVVPRSFLETAEDSPIFPVSVLEADSTDSMNGTGSMDSTDSTDSVSRDSDTDNMDRADQPDAAADRPDETDAVPDSGDKTPSDSADKTPSDSGDAPETVPTVPVITDTADAPEPSAQPNSPDTAAQNTPYLRPHTTANTFQLTDNLEDSSIKSQYAVLIDAQTGEILAERASDTLMYPASMTKVLTLLTAVDLLTRADGSWDLDSYTWNTKEISEYCWVNDCSMAWFTVGEWVPVRDTLYGMILPSGADAALMLANYAAGSHDAMVERMNEKARELGLSEGAHFENCVGLYGDTHICTVRDMAVIMKAAMDHPVCRTVLGKEVWTTSQTEEHPSGILLVNRFLRRMKSLDPALPVIGAKTGYVRQSGNCAVSMARRADGREYICVTGKGAGSMQVVQDHEILYRLFCADT